MALIISSNDYPRVSVEICVRECVSLSSGAPAELKKDLSFMGYVVSFFFLPRGTPSLIALAYDAKKKVFYYLY